MAESIALNVDCMEYMPSLPDNSFNLAIIDPPYGLKKSSIKGGKSVFGHTLQNKSDMEWDVAPSEEFFKQLFRISENQIIWGGNYFHLPPCRCFIVWDKMKNIPNFSQCEMAWTSFDSPARMFSISNTGGYLDYNRFHPTMKPVELYKSVMKAYAKHNQRIIDTHLGSGSSRIAAYKLGLDFVGCEINKEYYEKADRRFREECLGEYFTPNGVLKQLDLFEKYELR